MPSGDNGATEGFRLILSVCDLYTLILTFILRICITVVVTDASDNHVQVATYSYGGKVYRTTVDNGSTSKPHLIPVNLDKRRSAAAPTAEPASPSSKSNLAVAQASPPSNEAAGATSARGPTASTKPDGSPAVPASATTNGDAAFVVASQAIPHTSAPSSPDQNRAKAVMNSSSSALHSSLVDVQGYPTESDLVSMEGTYSINPETGEFESIHTSQLSGAGGQATTSQSAASETIVRYYINDEITKHRVRILGMATVKTFSNILRAHHKMLGDFAIFFFDLAENRLRVLKDSTTIDGSHVVYVLGNSRMDDCYRKVEKRVKKDLALSGKSTVWNSENNPLRVDFIPEAELYLAEAGRIGLCMCPGRKKKKAAHEWDRDLEADLLRIRDFYKCDVVVSLVRRSELIELKIPNLLEEVERLGMESIHFPIKDKWQPDSMADFIKLVDALVHRLKIGKTIVIHCNGGKGRSGTVAVACMVAMGRRVDPSIDIVRKARSGTIRNPIQVVYVKRFKTAFKRYQKKKQAVLETRGAALDKGDDLALAEQAVEDVDNFAESEESESDMEGTLMSKKEEKAAEKARKEEDKAAEKAAKARKEEEKAAEKAAEKARKEEEKAAEKAAEKARKEEDKAAKARKEEEKAAEKAAEKAKKKPALSPPLLRGSTDSDLSDRGLPVAPLAIADANTSSSEHEKESKSVERPKSARQSSAKDKSPGSDKADKPSDGQQGSPPPANGDKSNRRSKGLDKVESGVAEAEAPRDASGTPSPADGTPANTPNKKSRRRSAKKTPSAVAESETN